jgi:hypothetical protein
MNKSNELEFCVADVAKYFCVILDLKELWIQLETGQKVDYELGLPCSHIVGAPEQVLYSPPDVRTCRVLLVRQGSNLVVSIASNNEHTSAPFRRFTTFHNACMEA